MRSSFAFSTAHNRPKRIPGDRFTAWKWPMKTFLSVGLIALSMTGCGELSYKRGASAQDLDATKKSCQSAGGDQAIEKCLEENGWVVKRLDDMELFATASVTSDNRSPGIDEARNDAVKPPAADPVKSANSSLATADPGRKPSASNGPSPAPPPNPLDVYKVSSWWKLGAGREAMEADTRDCVTQLGDAHKPDNKTQQVTRAFVVCMHTQGWKALREK
ncbi:MAG: hypothetical protein Q7T97_17060 [Burkholderiaceae bacterium]|nr:hypothetical protein [Burkholderiaceae bacterium]